MNFPALSDADWFATLFLDVTNLTSDRPSGTPPRLRLRVTAAAERAIRGGHPWVFSDSIRESNRRGELGELAVIFDREDRFLAIGLNDPGSPLAVRILHTGKPVTLDDAWWHRRLAEGLERRNGLFDSATNGYRCVYGESDGLPGLVIDRYADAYVLKLYTAAWLPRLEALRPHLVDLLQPGALVLRLSRNSQELAREEFGREDGQLLFGELPVNPVVFLENGLRFEADVVRGQKTGFFLDQRENRRRVGTLAQGRDVLNAFSFSGGFSLYAARGGARHVTDLDISLHALDSARRNFALNQGDPAVRSARHETIQADTFQWLERNSDRRFGLVILDPPSMARRESERAGAIQAYGRLAAGGAALLERDGILVAASCSAHVSSDEFFTAVRTAVRRAGRNFEELESAGHPPDHTARFPEADYLKCIYLKLN